MTKFKGKLVLMALIVLAFTVSTVSAQNGTWEVESIESGPDDGFITETGIKYFETPWVQIKSKTTSLTSYFAFRGVDIPANVSILNAYLQFTAPGPTTFAPNASLDVTIYGLKTGDLTSWDPTPDLEGEPFTTAFTNWDATPLSHSAQINVTITDQVKEIYEMFSWTDGNDMGFRIVSVLEPSILAARYQVSYDSDPDDVMKLYIEYAESNSTAVYYKGFLISSEVGVQMSFTYNDNTDGVFRLVNFIREDGLNTTTQDIPGGLSFLAPDSTVSVGNDIYQIGRKNSAPYNVTLYKTIDRGENWINLGDIDSNGGSAGTAQKHAMVYDQNGSIHIAYAEGFDTYWRQFKILNQSFTATQMIHDGGFSTGAHRAYWDAARDTVWFTRSGGAPGNSAGRPTILRRPDSNGTWESYDYSTGYLDSDVVSVEGDMWWVINEDNDFLRAFELDNYTDLSSWVNKGFRVGGYTDVNMPFFDIGVVTFGQTATIAISAEINTPSEMWQAYWSGSDWTSNNYNLTGAAGVPTFHAPKIYYDSNGELRMGIIIDLSGGFSVMDKTWKRYLTWESLPLSGVVKATGHDIVRLGGDTFPFSEGLSATYTVYDENGTLIGTFDSLEEAEAAIDDIEGVGQTPDDPKPPGTNYPEEGGEFGTLTRFNVRFVLFGVGWVLILAPLMIMAIRPWPMKIYLVFVLCITLGFALQFSIGSI